MASPAPAEIIRGQTPQNRLEWEWLVGFRRALHMWPEPGFREEKTRAAIRHALLHTAGIDSVDAHPPIGRPQGPPGFDATGCTTTGMIVDVCGLGPPVPDEEARMIMLRADMDGLRMTEENSYLPYRSQSPGLAHMCGHDGHMAALVGAAVLLNTSAVRQKIPSNSGVRLLFQPAEETPGGAQPMIRDGALRGVHEVYGWHNWPTAPVGTLLMTDGTIMAHDADFYITISGRGGHGSAPHACIDPIPCGAAMVLALQTIVARTLPSDTNAVVSVTMFHAGEATNVIPDTAKLCGTIRDLDSAVYESICAAMRRIADSTAAAHQCTAEVQIVPGYAETANGPEGVATVRRVAQAEPKRMVESDAGLPLMGTEDFGYYLKELPGCFFLCGTFEERRTGLAALPFDGGEGYHGGGGRGGVVCPAAPQGPASKKKRKAAAPGDAYTAKSVLGAGWPSSNKPRTNCCPHGTTFDFNDNVLPFVVSMFLKIAEDRLCKAGSGFMEGFVDDGTCATFNGI